MKSYLQVVHLYTDDHNILLGVIDYLILRRKIWNTLCEKDNIHPPKLLQTNQLIHPHPHFFNRLLAIYLIKVANLAEY